MMDSTFSQPYILAAMMYIGIAAGFVYDILRSIVRGKNVRWSIFGDAVYFILLFIVFTYVSYFATRINIRAFHYLGIAIGFGIYWCGIKAAKDKLVKTVKKKKNKM